MRRTIILAAAAAATLAPAPSGAFTAAAVTTSTLRCGRDVRCIVTVAHLACQASHGKDTRHCAIWRRHQPVATVAAVTSCATVACDQQYLVQIAGPAGAACLEQIIAGEDYTYNPQQWNLAGSGAYGIPQALPGSKMASAGPDWQTNPLTQERWMLGYVDQLYGSPCAAAEHRAATGSY